MIRSLLAALALACALTVSACNPSDVSALQGFAATTPPTLPPSVVSPQALADAGLTPAAQSKVTNAIAAVQKQASALCGFRPLASGILNIGIALSPKLASAANSDIGQNVRGVATIACNALATAPAYSALGNRRGEFVTAYVAIGSYDRVPVYGIRTR
ncbi:hypothetical protein [Methylobacterium sp. WL9]|uniref:hypothetical protein n=1 Tax=Methylobacterium sp. WL9 TaxID=2603898 RepID=UPI0011C7755F|nr:hypothetical protein [Methylobacterium sp. WL9]TXN23978.1 hypothetical protein FV217_04745 [Methylobacterium sp. WL9]